MQPAARVGDATAHGTVLGGENADDGSESAGSPDVEIGGRPAWRAGVDFHECAMVTGVSPHVGGVVARGSNSVLINGYPAARMGDVIVESDSPNTIVTGEPTVLVGTGFSEPALDHVRYDPTGVATPERGTAAPTTMKGTSPDPESETPTGGTQVRYDGPITIERDSEAGIRFTHDEPTETLVEFEVRSGSAIDVYTMAQSEVEDHFQGADFETVPELSFPDSRGDSGRTTLPAGDWESSSTTRTAVMRRRPERSKWTSTWRSVRRRTEEHTVGRPAWPYLPVGQR